MFLCFLLGYHCYYGLCDIGACELEDIDVGIQLANRETIYPIGIFRDVEVLCGKTKYPADFLVLGSAASKTCPIILVDPF